ncbi:MAG TPA: hypothetical protein VFJ74_14495 [Gemmatimonadaceae bacterium]|nr:hypothetical protein [Gemmatimonadaceae bacterium]
MPGPSEPRPHRSRRRDEEARLLVLALLVADAFVALSAFAAAVALATGIGVDRFPRQWLDGTPFGSYLLPGLVVAAAIGGTAALAAGVLLHRADLGALASALAGAVLLGHVVVDVMVLRHAAWSAIELSYAMVGSAMVVIALWLRRAGPRARTPRAAH